MKRLLSLGAIAMDIILESSELPGDDGFALISEERMLPGGSAANVSVAASRLGIEVYQTGKVGDDTVGREFIRTLALDGVDTEHIAVRRDGTTLHCYIVEAAGGKHCILANLGDCVSSLDYEELEPSLMDRFDLLYVDLFSPDAALGLAKRAKELNKPVIYNMQCVPSFMALCHVGKDQIEEMLSLCTLFISNRAGYEELVGKVKPEDAVKILEKRYFFRDGAVMTMGSEGALWYRDELFWDKGIPLENIVDTTGAGDCFTGSLIYALYEKNSFTPDALRFANGAAALKCTGLGARAWADEEEIRNFMERR